MNHTTTAFMYSLPFQFVRCHLNAFMVNSHKSLTCRHLVLLHGKSSLLQRNGHTMTCQISRLLMMQSKTRITSC